MYADKSNALGYATSGQLAHGNAGAFVAVQGLNQPPKVSATVEMVNRLEAINGQLRDIVNSQNNLLERLHGPRPQAAQLANGEKLPSGLLNSIDERFNWVFANLQEAADNQRFLDNLA